MDNSPFFHEFIYSRLGTDSQEYFNERASACFASESSPSWIDVWVDSLTRGYRQSLDGEHSHATLDMTPLDPPLGEEQASEKVDKQSFTSKIEHIEDLRTLFSDNEASLLLCFVRQRNSLSRLSISWHLFSSLLQFCTFSPRALDFVLCFGLRNGETDVNPPAMYYHIRPKDQKIGKVMESPEIECAYLLRFVEPNHRHSGNPWSVRQTGVFHKISGRDASSKWIFLSISSQTQAQLEIYLSSLTNSSVIDAFEIHFLLIDSAVWGWRRYIVYLANEIQKQADRAVLVEFEAGDPGSTRLEERQYIKQIEDNVIDAITVLNFMIENLDTISTFYQAYKTHLDIAPGDLSNERGRRDLILDGLDARRRSLLLYQSQMESLYRKVQGVSSLVSNILELENGNALRFLGLETRIENANMATLTKKSVEDASSVKILTIVTLIYLPVTVVTNFFSTVFVTTKDEPGSTRLVVISSVWILVAASIPLTIITIYLWYSFARKEVHGRFPAWIETILRFITMPRTMYMKTREHGKESTTSPR